MRAGLFCGVMSGTSLDGIDAALIRFSRGAARIVAVARGRFRPALRRELLALCEKGDDEIERAQIAANEIARAYAAVVVDLARRAPSQIIAVGAHGQTIRHRPRAGFSTQLLNGALLAELTGIDVVCDFRARDIAAGGQGAPLACGFHQFAFARLAPCAVVNIGGVANATILRPDEPPRGWDVGPGNMLMDAWNQKHKNTPFDRGGEWARQARPSSRLLRRLLRKRRRAAFFAAATAQKLRPRGIRYQPLRADFARRGRGRGASDFARIHRRDNRRRDSQNENAACYFVRRRREKQRAGRALARFGAPGAGLRERRSRLRRRAYRSRGVRLSGATADFAAARQHAVGDGRARRADFGRAALRQMNLADFDFDLPPRLIAQQPPPRRGDARLLLCEGDGFRLARARALPSFARAGDIFVFNDSRVLPARVFARKASGGKVEILAERIEDGADFCAQLRAGKAPTAGDFLHIGKTRIRVRGREGDFYSLAVEGGESARRLFARRGETPLPPYIRRRPTAADARRYQTVFAQKAAVAGSVAAPTAGLHWTRTAIEALRRRGAQAAFITLHIGAGTFRPLRGEIESNRLSRERFAIDAKTAAAIRAARAGGGRVVAVGTTALRALETAAQKTGAVAAGAGETDLFVKPGFRFRAVDWLLTNFHLPKSSLFVLLCAFCGEARARAAYRFAIENEMRFYSYGDAMLIGRRC